MKIGIGGAQGRMGRMLIQVLANDPNPTFNDIIPFDRQNPFSSFSSSVSSLPSSSSLPNVFVDFTKPEAVLNHLQICVEHQIPMVIGVTGLLEPQKKAVQKAAETIPIVYAPNMSIGINLCYQLLALAAKTLKGTTEVAVQETHHKNKKDAPSGTALRMGEIVAKELGVDLKSINFASSRIGDVMGDHTILFTLPGERLEITHRSLDRSVFALGAIRAAKWVIGKEPNLYDMENVLF